MQIDFHHGTTYVVARLAGFSQHEAQIVAHAAQYVDDATSAGPVYFDNKAMYNRICSSYKMVDVHNMKEVANHLVWVPFHFLPGNGAKPAGENPEGKFINKIVCVRDSKVAHDLVRNTIEERDKPYGLHRLGVTLHVFADTYAHENFAGIIHPVNEVENAEEVGNSGVFDEGIECFLRDMLDDLVPPLGHGRANIFPDMPFLQWKYINYLGEEIVRDNTKLFCQAAQEMYTIMQRFRAGNPALPAEPINQADMKLIKELFLYKPHRDGHKRHEYWLTAINKGDFSFGAEKISYTAKGKGSWKEQAIGSNYDLKVHSYASSFLSSDWKLFHDALQAHRFYVMHDLLPRYSICAA